MEGGHRYGEQSRCTYNTECLRELERDQIVFLIRIHDHILTSGCLECFLELRTKD